MKTLEGWARLPELALHFVVIGLGMLSIIGLEAIWICAYGRHSGFTADGLLGAGTTLFSVASTGIIVVWQVRVALRNDRLLQKEVRLKAYRDALAPMIDIVEKSERQAISLAKFCREHIMHHQQPGERMPTIMLRTLRAYNLETFEETIVRSGENLFRAKVKLYNHEMQFAAQDADKRSLEDCQQLFEDLAKQARILCEDFVVAYPTN